MKTACHLIRFPLTPSWLRWLLGTIIVVLLCPLPLSADPPRLKRADAFLGVHFDFHAGKDCNRVGERTTRQMVDLVIDKVQPDYIQIDCKRHPGYSSYPTKVGNPAPGFVGDPLRVWRAVTRNRGVSLLVGWEYLDSTLRDQLAGYAKAGGRLLLSGKLSIHLVNTSGPHANPPAGGMQEVPSVGPLKVDIRLAQAPRAITQQPENRRLAATWSDGRASVTLPHLDLYSILVVE